MRKVGYGLGLLAACMLLFALGVRVLTMGDIGPAIRPYYEACETMSVSYTHLARSPAGTC